MVELTDEQYERVALYVKVSIVKADLQMELIDHCCCSIEELLTEGVPFDQAFDQALRQLSPNGIREVEEEVNFVLQSKISKIMKKLLYLTGFLAAFCILIGMMFKMMSWPFANKILLTGDLALMACMLIVQVNLFNGNVSPNKWQLMRVFAGSLGGLIVATGAAFKVMHWPFGGILFVVGIGIVTFFFLPIFFWQLYQKEIRNA
ncbi:MAG: hypothetical protein RLZZ77_48 [Bacteroidota bacterium]